MPGPPPPPPPGPPPPPSLPKLGGGDPNDRSALLKSIQKGAKLKKTVTNDKSAPLIGGKNNNAGSSNNQGSLGNGGASSTPNLTAMNGLNLGAMFANGRPKLKATGKLELPNNNNNNGWSGEHRANRGPPPAAPVRMSPDAAPQPLSHAKSNGDLHLQQSALHRKVKSNTNLHSMDSITNGYNSGSSNKPVISHGKPNLAPKPPPLQQQNGGSKPLAPPKKLIVNGKQVHRAQSMRSPRSPSPQQPPMDNAIKFGTVRNLQSVLGSQITSATSIGNLAVKPRLNGRPNIPPPGIPQAPLVPPHKVKPPSVAPPPPPTISNMLPQPPTHNPPLPPHRTAPTRAPPAVPQSAAPPPPPRNSSMVNRSNNNNRQQQQQQQFYHYNQNNVVVGDFDERFRKMFNDANTFPKPPPYKNVFKNYGNRAGTSKQQAPQPPIFQSKQWDSTATTTTTTSAC